eukprot:scaffold11044_cov30-Tisochrysis_lutea.AAC.1
MPVAMRIVQAGAAPPVESVGLGALLHEHSREAEMALRASHVQRAPPAAPGASVVTSVSANSQQCQRPPPRSPSHARARVHTLPRATILTCRSHGS